MEEVSIFENETLSVLDVRNMREHADNYLLPERQKQAHNKDRFVVDGMTDGGINFSADATADITDENGELWLGGRCNQNHVKQAAHRLILFLENQ